MKENVSGCFFLHTVYMQGFIFREYSQPVMARFLSTQTRIFREQFWWSTSTEQITQTIVHDDHKWSYVLVSEVAPFMVITMWAQELVVGVPRRQCHRRSGMANLPSVGAVP